MTESKKMFRKKSIPERRLIVLCVLLFGIFGIVPQSISSVFQENQSSPRAVGIIGSQIISHGWKIKSIDPVTELDLSILTDMSSAGGWLDVPFAPAMPHEILLDQKKIEAPWKPFGMEKCYWVSQKDWIYAVNFRSKNLNKKSSLIFKELKGTVDVYLNNSHVATHSDQSQPLVVDVTGMLQSDNQLVLHFSRPVSWRGNEPDRMTDTKDPSKRQAVGNYLGPNPRIYSLGLVGDVIFEQPDGSLMDEIITDFSLDDAFTKGSVSFAISGESRFQSVEVQVRLVGPDGKQTVKTVKRVQSDNGKFAVHPILSVKNPELWWPRGYGDQKLYTAEIALLVRGKVHQKEFRTIGFRKIEMPEKPYHFVVNGTPVFLRGGDWVTPNLMSDVWDPERVSKLFDLAENANFNTFRVWGPVDAPCDEFYEMADARGFLIWQDFTKMDFSKDKKTIQRCVEKAQRFVKRLKHHPCILLWCGINEAAMWWHGDYNHAFEDRPPWPGLKAAQAVGKVCQELDPDRHYTPSTPYGGVNANDPRVGTTNGYTNMWFVPAFDYLNFASEDTRIACPTLHSMEQFMLPEEICPEGYTTLALHGDVTPFPETWMPYTTSESWLKTGPVEQFYDATDAASLVNRIGMAEGVYYRDVVERQRRGRPATEQSDRRACGGYLVWKFNDSWPQIYAGKVDYFLEPYHAYYTLKAAYAPVILSFDIGTYIYLWAVNDSTEPVQGTVKIQLYHLKKNMFRHQIVKDIMVPPGKSLVVSDLDADGIRAFRKEFILFAELKDADGRVIARTDALADIERRLQFPDAKLDVKVKDNALFITTDKFARNINLEGNADGDKLGWFFEDNYFDLLPGEVKKVRILGRHSEGVITAKPWYSPHVTQINWKNN